MSAGEDPNFNYHWYWNPFQYPYPNWLTYYGAKMIEPAKFQNFNSNHPLLNNQANELIIVSHCLQCNAPIYGKEKIKVGEPAPITYSCDCRVNKDATNRFTPRIRVQE